MPRERSPRTGYMVVGITPETQGKFCALCYPLPQSEEEARSHHQGRVLAVDAMGSASLEPGSGFGVRKVRIVGTGKKKRVEVVE